MTESIDDPGNTNPPAYTKARVILFKPSGKYYCEEEWRIPKMVPVPGTSRMRNVIGPYDMGFSPDFRRISGGSVLVETQEPWNYPHLFPGGSQWAPAIEAERSAIDQINVDPLKLEVVPKTIDTYERVLSGLKGLQFPTSEKRTCVCAHPFDAHYDEPNSTCRGTYCRCHSFRVDTTKAEQSSSYYKSAQSERSSQSQEPQLSGRSQCKSLHDHIVAALEAHKESTLRSGHQVTPELEKAQLFHTSLALLMSLVAECPTCYTLVALNLNSLHQQLDYSHHTHKAHYSAPPTPLIQPPEIPVSSDLPRRVKRPIGPGLIDPQTPNSD